MSNYAAAFIEINDTTRERYGSAWEPKPQSYRATVVEIETLLAAVAAESARCASCLARKSFRVRVAR
jgi:hypothetical protein